MAFGIVKMDQGMARAAQFVQVLVGAMAGTGWARGKETVQRGTIVGILKGRAISPISGASLCFVLYKVVALATGG